MYVKNRTIADAINLFLRRWPWMIEASILLGFLSEIEAGLLGRQAKAVVPDQAYALFLTILHFLALSVLAYLMHRDTLRNDYGFRLSNGCGFAGFCVRVLVISFATLVSAIPLALALSLVGFPVLGGLVSLAAMYVCYGIVGLWLPAGIVDRKSTFREAIQRGRHVWFAVVKSMLLILLVGVLALLPAVLLAVLFDHNAFSAGRAGAFHHTWNPGLLLFHLSYGLMVVFFAVGGVAILCREFAGQAGPPRHLGQE